MAIGLQGRTRGAAMQRAQLRYMKLQEHGKQARKYYVIVIGFVIVSPIRD